MAVNLIDSNDITISQTEDNIQLNTSVDLSTLNNDINEIKTIVSGTITDGIPYKTGKKYNNKDVYRLIKNLGNLPSGALNDREISIGISGIDLISPAKISYQGVVSNVKRFYSNPFLGSTNINAWISDTGKIYVTTGADRSNLQLVIDIEFIYNN